MSGEPKKAKRKLGRQTSKGLKGKTGKGKSTKAIRKRPAAKAAHELKTAASQVKTEEHQLHLSMVKALPDQVEAGAEMKLQLRIVCSEGCELKGRSLAIMAGEAALLDKIELYKYGETANYTSKFSLQAPFAPGKYAWTVVLSPSEQDPLHAECLMPFTLHVKPHVTSIAVWDVASPIEVDSSFKIKAGVHCLAGCSLGGQKVEVYDQDGIKVAVGNLSTSPYSDQVKLYWVDLELKAPAIASNYNWQVRFHEPSLDLPHEGTSCTFGFATVKPADCELAVKVINKETGAPIKQAEVTLHPNLYHGITDDNGVAKIALAGGEYKLTIFASEKAPSGIKYTFKGNLSGRPFTTDGRESMFYVPDANTETMMPFQTAVKVEGDTAISVELVGVIVPLIKDTM